MMQKVLITGASGFVGFHLIEKCLAENLDVYVAIRKSSNINHLQSYQLKYVYPNYNETEALQRNIEENKYDFIIHAAGSTKARDASEYNLVNATYTANLVKAVNQSKHQVKKMVFMSSLGAIGPSTTYNQMIAPGAPPRPVTAYGKSKLLAEELLTDCKVPLVILRPTAVYGPREKDIFIVLKTISQGFEPYIGKVDQQLSFIYVKDLAELTINALFSTGTGSYNITDGKCYSRYQLGDITRQVLKRKTIRFHIPYLFVKGLVILLENGYRIFNRTAVLNNEKLNELTALNWCCDISKAENELGFKPRYDLEKGLTETLAWYKENKWL